MCHNPGYPEKFPKTDDGDAATYCRRDEPHLIARMPAQDLWMTFFRDSEENLLALMSEVPR